MVRSQFVTTLYKALSGMVENAEKAVKKAEDDWTADTDGLASPVAMVVATNIGAGTINASDRVSLSSEFTIILTNIFRMSVCF
jgi:exocyst complex component 2